MKGVIASAVIAAVIVAGSVAYTNHIDKAIFEAEQEVAKGAELLDAREALGKLRRKHFG